MKTPMQEMIDYFEIFYDAEKSNQKMPISNAMSIAKFLLEKEKDVMCKFAERYLDSIPKEHPSVEDVYNETFNTKEK